MFENLFEGRFYTYLYLREDGTPYYVGKGKAKRAFYIHSHRVKPPRDRSRILLQEFPSELDAFEAEKFLIAYYGRLDLGTGSLHNLTDGGEGNANRSEQTRHKQSIAKQGKPLSESHRISIKAACSTGNVGKASPSAAVRQRISQSLQGRAQSRTHIQARMDSMKDVFTSDAYRAKMRAAANKRWHGATI